MGGTRNQKYGLPAAWILQFPYLLLKRDVKNFEAFYPNLNQMLLLFVVYSVGTSLQPSTSSSASFHRLLALPFSHTQNQNLCQKNVHEDVPSAAAPAPRTIALA